MIRPQIIWAAWLIFIGLLVILPLVVDADGHHKSGHGGGNASGNGVIYRNGVGLSPGEKARFRAEVKGKDVFVFVKDHRSDRAKVRLVRKGNGIGFRVRRVRIRVTWPEDLFVRVKNLSNNKRRIGVVVYR